MSEEEELEGLDVTQHGEEAYSSELGGSPVEVHGALVAHAHVAGPVFPRAIEGGAGK